MTSGFVFLDNAVCNSTIDHGYGTSVGRICRFIISGIDGSKGFLDCGAECRSLTRIMPAPGFILSCSFLGLS